MRAAHVTEVLSPYQQYGMVDPDVLRAASERGRHVHAYCAAYAVTGYAGSPPAEIEGYVLSFRRWFDRYVKRVLLVEDRITSEALGLTGAVDLVAEMTDDFVSIIDLKTPAVGSRTWRAQLAAYGLLLRTERGIHPNRIMALRLKKNGGPAKADVYADSDAALAAYLSALNAYRYFKKVE